MKHVFAILRFFNLLEPGKNILSITKTAMWLCVIGFWAAIFTSRPVDVVTLSAFFATNAMYAWRRYIQWKTGTILGDTPAVPTSAPQSTGE